MIFSSFFDIDFLIVGKSINFNLITKMFKICPIYEL